MDEAMRDLMADAGKRYLQRFDKFDDQAIGKAWVEIARREPSAHARTHKGLQITITRTPSGPLKVSYEAYLSGFSLRRKQRVAWMHCMTPIAGRVQVTNANVYDVHGTDYRRRGIGTAMYDLIERDVRAAGGDGLEPHWGSMSDEAIAFWEKRRPEYAGQIAKLNRLGTASSWLFD